MYSGKIEQLVGSHQKQFDTYKANDNQTKEQHLRLFRPNLENPANKTMTEELNKKEIARSDKLKEVRA